MYYCLGYNIMVFNWLWWDIPSGNQTLQAGKSDRNAMIFHGKTVCKWGMVQLAMFDSCRESGISGIVAKFGSQDSPININIPNQHILRATGLVGGLVYTLVAMWVISIDEDRCGRVNFSDIETTHQVPSGKQTVCYWRWPIEIVDLPS